MDDIIYIIYKDQLYLFDSKLTGFDSWAWGKDISEIQVVKNFLRFGPEGMDASDFKNNILKSLNES